MFLQPTVQQQQQSRPQQPSTATSQFINVTTTIVSATSTSTSSSTNSADHNQQNQNRYHQLHQQHPASAQQQHHQIPHQNLQPTNITPPQLPSHSTIPFQEIQRTNIVEFTLSLLFRMVAKRWVQSVSVDISSSTESRPLSSNQIGGTIPNLNSCVLEKEFQAAFSGSGNMGGFGIQGQGGFGQGGAEVLGTQQQQSQRQHTRVDESSTALPLRTHIERARCLIIVATHLFHVGSNTSTSTLTNQRNSHHHNPSYNPNLPNQYPTSYGTSSTLSGNATNLPPVGVVVPPTPPAELDAGISVGIQPPPPPQQQQPLNSTDPFGIHILLHALLLIHRALTGPKLTGKPLPNQLKTPARLMLAGLMISEAPLRDGMQTSGWVWRCVMDSDAGIVAVRDDGDSNLDGSGAGSKGGGKRYCGAVDDGVNKRVKVGNGTLGSMHTRSSADTNIKQSNPNLAQRDGSTNTQNQVVTIAEIRKTFLEALEYNTYVSAAQYQQWLLYCAKLQAVLNIQFGGGNVAKG
ncbi:hypothetical protein HDU76_010928 [Blyttiomyces sp. JEL0837]|nr:hypothetical protein HDU76_010928 [Blyttiomyces sp. JEL0837]